MLEVVDEGDLESDLRDGDDAVDDVELVGEARQVGVEGPGDDGEDHVEEGEDGGESKQAHVEVHLDGDVATGQIPEAELLDLSDADDEGDDAEAVDDGVK